MQFLLYTNAKSGQVVNAKWLDVETDLAHWGTDEGFIPLSPEAMKIVTKMQQIKMNKFIFCGSSPEGNLPLSTFKNLLEHLNYEISVGGFKDTFSEWVADQEDLQSPLTQKTDLSPDQLFKLSVLRKRVFENWSLYINRTMIFTG